MTDEGGQFNISDIEQFYINTINYFSTAEKYYDSDMHDPKNRADYYTFMDNPKIPCKNYKSEQSMRKVVMKRASSVFSISVRGADSMCVILSLVQSARMNRISPDKYVGVLLENLKDLKDERVAASYLPWSKTLKEKIGFTPQEISEATKEAEEEIRNHKKPSNP